MRLCKAKPAMCTPLLRLGVQNQFLHQLPDGNQNHALDLFYSVVCRNNVSVTLDLPSMYLIIPPLSLIPCHPTLLFLNANVQSSPCHQILLLSLMNIDKKPFVSKKNNLCFQWSKNKTPHTNDTQMAKGRHTNDTQMAKSQTQMTHRWQKGRHKRHKHSQMTNTFTNDTHIHK